MVQEVVLAEPRKALVVDVECAITGVGGTCSSNLDRFALVEPEPGDLHESEGVRRVFTKRGHDLAAV
jgi:hypothetical protein